MIAFFAATPLQMFNCINIKETHFPKERADIFLMTYATDLSKFSESLKNSGIFENVTILSVPFNKKGRLKFLLSYLFPSGKVKKNLQNNVYDIMFATRIGPAAIYYYSFLHHVNNKIRFEYYEEGIGDYWTDAYYLNFNSIKVIEKIGYINPYKEKLSMWLYRPEYTLVNKQCEMHKIDKVSLNNEWTKKMASVFNITKSLPADCKLIYFEQPFFEQRGITVNDLILLKEMEPIISKDNIYIKLHPGSLSPKRFIDQGYKILDFGDIPWEILIAFIELENVILAGISTTAIITPKLIYDMEPRVILLHKCVFDNKKYKNSEFFDLIAASYKKSNKFIQPACRENIKTELEKLFTLEETERRGNK